MNTETKVENWIEGKVGAILQIGSTIVCITVVILTGNFNTELLRKDVVANAARIEAVQTEVNLISTNHLAHIQASVEAMNICITRLSTQLEEHLKQSK